MKKHKFRTIAAVAAAFLLVFAVGMVSAWAIADLVDQGTEEQGVAEQGGKWAEYVINEQVSVFEWVDENTPPVVFPVNENGQTYGSMHHSVANPPDLISVSGQNGAHGYVLKEQLYSVANMWATVEEMNAIWADFYHDAAAAFVDKVRLWSGVELDAEEVEAVLYGACVLIDEDGGSRGIYEPSIASLEYLNPKGFTAVMALMPEGYQTRLYADAALSAAWAVDDVLIPVYAQDGMTVIGEFLIR